MAQINKSTDYFDISTWTATTSAISNLGFSPDWVWIKSTDSANGHILFDTIRGANERLSSASSAAESTRTDELMSFDSNGYTLGSSGNTNDTNPFNASYVGWSWRGSDSSAVSNTDGSITSTVSANNTSGFSVITWTGDGVGSTVGTGLSGSETIGFATVKKRSTTSEWQTGVYGAYSANPRNFAYHLELNSTSALSGSSPYMMATQNSGDPSLLKLSTEGYVNGVDYVAYVFKPVKGFSKFGSYTGNGSTNGTFVYTGFKPAFVIIKDVSGARSWIMLDNKRNTFNVANNRLFPDSTDAQNTTVDALDFLSNGFKIRSTNTSVNVSGNTYIYMCFAENPFVTSNRAIPATAR